jgi:hypothetical protein
MGVELLPVTAAVDYQFPLGPVACKVVYVPDPLVAKVLVPYGQFDDYLVDRKFNEALRMVTVLGASEVTSTSFVGESLDGGGEASYKGIGVAVRGNKARQREVNYHQRGAGSQPRDPAPLLWPDEPGFEAAREAVLFNGAVDVEIRVTSSQAYSAESDLAGALKKAGFTLAASVHKSGARSYILHARFPGNGSVPSTPLDPEVTPMMSDSAEPRKRRSWFT